MITYEFPPTIGRFGDQLITWLKAQWAAHIKRLSSVYVPFLYSDHLNLCQSDNAEAPGHTSQRASNLDNIVSCDDKTLYVLDYNFKDPRWRPMVANEEWKHFDDMFFAMKRDVTFFKKVFQKMKPSHEVALVQPPKHSISVAVHMRTGGDWPPDKTWPYHRYLRFLPLDYYGHQIAFIAQHFKSRPLYVYIFTDDSNPTALVEQLKKIAQSPYITWDWRKTTNRHDLNVIEDMWSMAQFNCLIRPWSQLSRIAEFLGNHQLVTFPIEHKEEDDRHIITFELRCTNKKPLHDTVVIKK